MAAIEATAGSLSWQHDQLCVHGPLTYNNVHSIYQESLRHFSKSQAMTINFSDIHDSKSASIILMIAWCRYCYQNQIELSFEGINDNLIAIAKSAKLTSLLFPSNHS